MVQPEWLLPLALLVVIFSPRLVVVLLVLGAGFAGGVYAATRDKPKIATLNSDSTLEERLRKMDLIQPQLLSSFQTNLSSQIAPTTLSVPLDMNVHAAQSRLISLIVKDFVKSWYEAINLSHSDEFPNAVTASLHSAFLTLGEAAAKTKVVHIVSPITQTLIRHIYEYRVLETSALPLDVYLERNPRSSFNRYLNRFLFAVSLIIYMILRYVDAKESNKFLRKLSAHIISAILPKQDSESPVVFSILREIVATSVLGGIVDTYSDPDYINQALIAYIKSVKEAAAAAAAIEAAYDDEYEDYTPSPTSISTLDQPPLTSSNQPNPASSKRNNNTSASKETKQKASSTSKEKQIKSAVTNPTGDQLYVKVVEAKHMPMGQGSFFCSVAFGNSTLRSEKVAADTQPYWKEDFLFDWSHSLKNTYIRIDIYDALMIRDAFIGSVYILASDVQANKYSKDWYPIDTSESRVASGAQMAQLNVEAMVISISNLDRMEEPGFAENNGAVADVGVPAHIPSPVLEESVNEENEWEDMNVSVVDGDAEIHDPVHLMDMSGEGLSIETLAASSMDSLQVLEPKIGAKNQYVLDPLPSFSTPAPVVVAFQPRPQVAEPLTVAEAIRHPFYKDNFESYLDSYQALEYLHLYRDLMIMKPDIRLDEARDIYSIYFHTQTNVNVDRATFEDLKSLVTGEVYSDDSSFRKDLFERIKMEVLETLDMFWIKFQAQPGFQVPQDPAPVDILSSVAPPQQKAPPAKPPRAGTVQESDKTIPQPQTTSSELLLELPAATRPTVPARPKVSPPLPLRESSPLEALAPSMPPPLPSRPSAQEEEAETRKKREEDDLMLALALQEEENRNAAALRNAARQFPERRSSTHPNYSLDSSSGGGNGFFSAPAVARSTHLSGPIASEIAIVKERIMVIEQRLGETMYPVEGGHELVENKLKLQSLLVRLNEMLALAEETEFQSSYSSVPTLVHLYNAKVSITDLSDFDGSESMSAKEYLGGLLFGVQVEPTGSASAASTGGWVLTRSLTQFSMCHDDLSSIFPKMEKCAFPSLSPASLQAKPQSAAAADARTSLCADLEAWVRIILSDQVLCQAMCVHELLQSERLMSRIEEARKLELLDRQQQQQQQLQRSGGTVRGQVFGALKSAGSVLKNVAVSTGSVIGNAAAAVARDVKEEFSESSKLVGGGEVKRSGSNSVMSGSRSAGNANYDAYRLKTSAAEYSSLPTANSSDSDLPNTEELRKSNTPAARKSRSPTRDDQSKKSGKSPSPNKSKVNPQPTSTEESQMSPQELAILLECAFGIIEEVFNLSDPNQWIRQKGLQVVKSVLRNNYGKTISASIQTQVDDIRSPESVSGYLNSISDNLWPNGEWMYSTPDYLAELEANKLNPRTDQQRTDTRIEAKDLFLNNAALLGLDGIQTVVGKTNTTVGLSRLFNMLQQRDLNRGLVCAVLEAMIRADHNLSSANKYLPFFFFAARPVDAVVVAVVDEVDLPLSRSILEAGTLTPSFFRDSISSIDE
ncbi:sorting nexin 13 [Chytriomyces hyalinus]|nr:sorting nexin 13 [Chytriomyces hyalinus]